jgi:hypothetical protein
MVAPGGDQDDPFPDPFPSSCRGCRRRRSAAGDGKPALAGGADPWAVQAASAELTVYQFYCAPGLDVDLGPHPVVNSMQVAMASSSFRFEYGANCRDYYLGEIEPILTEFATGTDIAGAK